MLSVIEKEQKDSGIRMCWAEAARLDKALFPGGGCLDGLNRYAYCQNNPVRYIDPTGQGVTEIGTGRYVNTETGELCDENGKPLPDAPKKNPDPPDPEPPSRSPTETGVDPELTKRPDKSILQSDPLMKELFPNPPPYGFKVGPCLEMSLIAAWEKILGYNFTATEIAAITLLAQKSGDLTLDYYVNSLSNILQITRSVADPATPIDIKISSEKTTSDFSILRGSATNGTHFALGDVDLNIIHDPYGPGTMLPGWQLRTYLDVWEPTYGWYMRN